MTDLRAQVESSLGNGYTIDRELGGGGMSRVFVAHDATLRRDVVIKVLPPELLAGVNLERFRREILVAAGLQHPHIVPVLSSGETDGLPWFSMPLVQGESLRQRLSRGPLPIGEAVSIMREVAKALAYAHERGVVHRDIKPDNVLITGGTAVVTDFGIAKALSASRTDENPGATRNSLTQVGMSIGTPVYMAPEQAAADPNTDARADIYSFGCMAYELLAGRPPFVGMPPQRLLAAHMGERPQTIAELRRDTPPLVAELIMSCLEKEPAHRPATASDVVRVLDLASTTSGGAAAAASVLLGGRVSLPVVLGIWLVIFGAAWLLAKAAIVGIGLPSWVLPGALIVAGLGLPAILFTAYVQRTAHRALMTTPTLTPGGTMAPQGTMATIAVRASKHVSWRRTRRGGVLAFGAFVFLVAAFMGLRALGIGPAGSLLASGRIAAKAPLLVTDFQVHGADSSLAGVVAEGLRASLQQSTAVSLVPASAVSNALLRMQAAPGERVTLALARSLAPRVGAAAIVDGDVTALGSGFVVSVRLLSGDSGRVLATVQRAANNPSDLINTIDGVGRDLRARIGESLRSVQNAPALEQVTTGSLEALRAYTEGTRMYNAHGFSEQAVALLTQAVTIDPQFASAWRKLGVVYTAGGYPAEAGDSAQTRAFNLRDHLTPRERWMTEGTYYMTGPSGNLRNRALAMAATERLLAEGDTAEAGVNQALLLISQRQYARAESLFDASLRKGGPRGLVQEDEQQAFVDMGRRADAERLVDDYEQEHGTDGRPASNLLRAQNDLGFADYDGAAAALDTAITGPPVHRARALRMLAEIALVRGQFAQARLQLARSSSALPQSERASALIDSLFLSLSDVTEGDPARAVRRTDAALAAQPLSTVRPSEQDYLDIATIYARAGHPDRARRMLALRSAAVRDTDQLRSEVPLVHRVMGEVDIAENHPLAAVREFWQGDSLPDGPIDDCDACTFVNLARAYDHAQMPDSAIVYFDKFFTSTFQQRSYFVDAATRGPAARRAGELYEARGDRARAMHYYQMFVELWRHADPELQPQVTEVQHRLDRLQRGTG